jgi:uncharacterized membrane protein YhaH (DUF805 family)
MQWTGNVTPVGGPAYAAPASAVADPLDVPNGSRKVGLFRAIALGFKQYVKFSGRSSRSEFWWWALFYYGVSLVIQTPGYIQWWHTFLPAWKKFLNCLDANVNSNTGDLASVCKLDAGTPWLLWLGSLLLLGLFLPSLAVGVRRLHDTSRSGWWVLLWFVPFGIIILIVWWAFDSHATNQYGTPPRKGEPVAGPGVPSS